MRSTAEVLDHHLKCFAARDMDGVLADYSADAVFFRPEGARRGPNAIEPVFERMFAEFAKPGASVARKQRLIEGEYAYIVLDIGNSRQFVRGRQRYLCYSERKHSLASFYGEGQTEALTDHKCFSRDSGISAQY